MEDLLAITGDSDFEDDGWIRLTNAQSTDGFLNGARAQKESLCRFSGLYACLVGNERYEYHRARRDPMYSNYAQDPNQYPPSALPPTRINDNLSSSA
jgi:hypothetical protein